MSDAAPGIAIRRHIIRKIFYATSASERVKLRDRLDAGEVTFLADALDCRVGEIDWGDREVKT